MNFSKKELGDNVKITYGNDGSAIYRMQGDLGYGIMTVYDVFPGVCLIYNDFFAQRFASDFHTRAELFCIDHCRQGRIEWKIDQNKYTYMGSGDLQISKKVNRPQDFRFPLAHYHGITITFAIEEAKESLLHVMDGFSVDLEKIKEKLCPDHHAFVMRSGKQIEHIFSELYTLPEQIRIPYFKIKVLELLLFLNTMDIPVNAKERPYFYKVQVDKVEKIASLLTADLEQWYTLEQLSAQFDFPLTSMKLCFKGIYGTSIYSYMKTYRMNAAALMLKELDETIAAIAGRVGYDNASKFAAAFTSVIGVSPSRYRKSSACLDSFQIDPLTHS